jgi:hypothetical protein
MILGYVHEACKLIPSTFRKNCGVDTSIALATGSTRAMLEWLDQHGKKISQNSIVGG